MRFEEARSGPGSEMSVAEDETLVREWTPASPRLRKVEETAELDTGIVNMPVKRNLDPWCFAEHMDAPVLLQVEWC